MGVFEEDRQRELNDIKKLMDDALGRRILHRLLTTSGCLNRPVIPVDAESTMYREGQRSIGFDFFADIMDVSPKKFMVMILEAKERETILMALMEKEQERINEQGI